MSQLRQKPGYRKAAMLLVALESKVPDVTAQILAEMGQDKAKELIRAVSALGKISQDDIRKTVNEFYDLAVEKHYLYGGKDVSAQLLEKSFGITSEDAYYSQEMRFFDFLDDIKDEDLLTFLATENKQAQGLLLHYMPDDRVASLFAQLPTDTTKRLSQVLLGFEVPNPNLLWGYHQKLKSIFLDDEGVSSASEKQYLQKLARVLENLGDQSREDILEDMRVSNKESAAKLEALIFTFADLVDISDQDLEAILYEVEQIKTLAVALQGAEEALTEKVNANISDRIQLILDEEIDTLPELEDAEIQQAQRDVLSVARRLEKESKIKTLQNKAMKAGGDS